MTAGVGIRIALVVFVIAIVQVSVLSSVVIGGAAPELLLVTGVAIGLLRGAIAGSITGFAAGLVVDVATLGTLGFTSLLLTLVGFWAGRYGETTGYNRAQAPLLASVAAAVAAGFGGYALASMLGGPVDARAALVSLPATVVWSALLAYPVFALVRALIGGSERVERAREVELLV